MPNVKRFLFLSIGILYCMITVVAQSNDSPWAPPIGKKSSKNNNNNEKSFSLSLGFGTSYGGYGTKLNYLISDEQRIGIQVGGGYYFGDIMYSGAIKFYLWKNLFCDLKYGMFQRKFDLQYDGNYEVNEDMKIVSGPGIMLGYELDFIKNIGLCAGGGFNYDTKYKQGVSYSYDIGLLYRF